MTSANDPGVYDPRILAGGDWLRRADPAGEQVIPCGQAPLIDPCLHGVAGMVGQLEADRHVCFALLHGSSG